MSDAQTPMVGVRFRRAGKVYYFQAENHTDLLVGDHVVVDTTRGRELGWVVIAPSQVVGAQVEDLKPVLRRATEADLAGQDARRAREPETLAVVRARIRDHGLPMKAVLAEHSFDGNQVTVYFVSEEQRVDFRELVRDLARDLRTRVHLRQIGPRDQAKLLGGIDRCGRELCCTTWLPEFQPIAIKMAKNQNLPLNPSEISGLCGKLLCCLAFEDEQYAEMRTGLPKVGAKLTSAVGKGRVVDVNVLTRRITIAWETGSRVEVSADEFAEQQQRRNQALAEGQPLPLE
jgi:cell fate regulator YaaT (PSP1 superfamily)